MSVIVFFGPPCSGKGTLSKLLSEKLDMEVIDTGSMIRKEGKDQTVFGLFAKKIIDTGNLVPNKYLIPKMREWIMEKTNNNGLIFDGYPRSVEQAKDLDVFTRARKTPVMHFFSLEADVSVLKERLIERGKTSGRADDKIEFFGTRMKNHTTKAQPILDYFKNRGIMSIVDTNKSIQETIDEILSIVNQ